MANMKAVEKGLGRFIEYEIMGSMPNGSWQKLVAGTAVALGIKNLENTLMSYKEHPLIKMLGLWDDHGDIDIDSVGEALKSNLKEGGMRIEFPLIGYVTFHEDDVDTLKRYIRGEV